jgi:uncharacterized UPF0160 family protein
MQIATSGLIYCHFGRNAINKILSDRPHPQLPPENLEFHYESLYPQFVQEIDGRALEIPRLNQNRNLKPR